MESFTVEQFQTNFDNLMEKVENGESFIVTSSYGNAIVMPYNSSVGSSDDDLIRIHTDHEEAS